jgi:creatinine amidohydrolase
MKQPFWGPYERLRPAQIEAIRAEHPIAYVPWGALEWHSYHNPIGLDGMQAHGQCTALARHTGGVVLPPIYVGTDTIKPYKGFPHTIEHRAETVRTLATELLEQLADEGFRVIVVLTGHCGEGHTDALQAAGEAFTKSHPDVGYWIVPAFAPIQDTYPSNHAARGETSFQLLFNPDLVDLSLLPTDREPTLDEDGVWGKDPRRASAEEGALMLDLFVERALPRIQKMLDRHVVD